MGQGAALHVSAAQLLFDKLLSCFFGDWNLSGIHSFFVGLLSKIDLVAHENFGNIGGVLRKLGEPLSRIKSTFLRAFTKELG